jgi:hypothetical protein
MTTRAAAHSPSGELHRAQRAVGLLRIYLVFSIALRVVALLGFAASSFTDRIRPSSGVGTGAFLLLLAGIGLYAFLLRELERMPLLVSAAVTGLVVIGFTLTLIAGEVDVTALLVLGFLAYVLANAVKVQRLARENPESFYAREVNAVSRRWSTAIGVALAALFFAVFSVKSGLY